MSQAASMAGSWSEGVLQGSRSSLLAYIAISQSGKGTDELPTDVLCADASRQAGGRAAFAVSSRRRVSLEVQRGNRRLSFALRRAVYFRLCKGATRSAALGAERDGSSPAAHRQGIGEGSSIGPQW